MTLSYLSVPKNNKVVTEIHNLGDSCLTVSLDKPIRIQDIKEDDFELFYMESIDEHVQPKLDILLLIRAEYMSQEKRNIYLIYSINIMIFSTEDNESLTLTNKIKHKILTKDEMMATIYA